jgi:hypothetical protein
VPAGSPWLAVTVLGVALCLALLAPAGASAHFVRPFLHQITGTDLTGTGEVTAGSDVVESVVTSGGAFSVGEEITGRGIPTGTTILLAGSGKLAGVLLLSAEATETTVADELTVKVPFSGPTAVAVDGEAPSNDLWVLDGGNSLAEFGPSGVYRQTLEPPSLAHAEHLAIGSSGTFYVSSDGRIEIFSKTGVLERTFSLSKEVVQNVFGEALAVDDSTGDIYGMISSPSESSSLQKFNAAGGPVAWESFKGSESCGCSVSGNEIIFSNGAESRGVAVDQANGDIWVVGDADKVVFEFSPGGDLLREVTGEEAPGLGEEHGGFSSNGGTEIGGLAVDPTNGDLLVALSSRSGQGGVVDEFDAEGAFLGQITEAAGQPLSGAHGVAVDSEGHVYVVNRDRNPGEGGPHAVDEFEAGHFVPGLRPGAATRDRQSSAVLNGFVDPESELNPERIGTERVGIVDCRFEYVSEAAYKTSGFADLSSGGEVPCEDPDAVGIPKDDAYTPVHAAVSEHVESGVTYRYRLSATTGGLLGGSEHTAALAFTAADKPGVSATAASGVTSTFARLSGDVAPFGADTSYQFQYLSEEQFRANGESFAAASVVPASPVDVGSGGEAGDLVEAVSEQVGGLAPGTTYRFRLVAVNEVGVSEGEPGGGGGEVAHMFATEPAVSQGLPEGRAYELVTPPDKEGSEDMFRESSGSTSIDTGASSESGDQFVLQTGAAFGPFPSSGVSIYVFSRHPVGGHPERTEWSYASLVSPALGLQNLGSRLGAIEPGDFSTVAVNDLVGGFGSEVGGALTSLLGLPGGPYTTLHADQATHVPNFGSSRGYPQERTEVVGASRDLGVVVLQSTNPRLAEGKVCEHDFCAEPPISNLYEWVGGEMRPLDVQSDGEPIGSCGAVLGSGPYGAPSQTREEDADNGAVSADGSKVFFTAPDPGVGEGVKGCPTKGGENPPEIYMRSGEETVEVSAPAEGAPEHKAHYGAVFMGAADDGSRVFFTSEGELTANDAGIHDVELYEYDTETGKLTRISAGDSGDATGGVVPFVERVNIVNEVDEEIKNVVVASDGSHVYFVGRGVLAPANAEGRSPVEGESNLYVYDAQTGRVAFITSGAGGHYEPTESPVPETTPDGRYLLFQGEMVARGSVGLYRYDADTEAVVCVTCTPSVPSGVGIRPPSAMEDTAGGTFPARAIAEDGSVFFDTAASLVPQATNGLTDVYEWHEGTISLISSGQDALPSFFLGASPNGANVFFGTHARLVPADIGSGGNLYDARVCTASEPCITPAPGREGLCEGDACSHPAAAPSDATPASATFSGQGDLTPAPSVTPKAKTCVKPKKLSHGKCVAVKPKRGKTKRKARAGGGKARARRATRSGRGGGSS